MNLFLFFFSIIILLCIFMAIRKYGMTERFLSDFTIEDLESIEYDPDKNVFVSKRFQDFHDCSIGKHPTPIKSNFITDSLPNNIYNPLNHIQKNPIYPHKIDFTKETKNMAPIKSNFTM
jgi:hypothetical protein